MDLEVRKKNGSEHLKANRIEDALAVFAGILRDYPEDIESLSALGDLFLSSGNNSTAVKLYSRVNQQKKRVTEIEQTLQLAQSKSRRIPNNISIFDPIPPKPKNSERSACRKN